MVLFNTLVGLMVGFIALRVASIAKIMYSRKVIQRGEGLALVLAGVPTVVLSLYGALTWPLNVNPPINIAFWEPALLVGLLAIGAGWRINVAKGGLIRSEDSRPTYWLVATVGLAMFATSMAVFRFNLVGDAPSIEPITGQFKGWENATFGIVYLLAALACMLMPFGGKRSTPLSNVLWLSMVWMFRISGTFFLLFSALNYYTHIGMLRCAGAGVCYSF